MSVERELGEITAGLKNIEKSLESADHSRKLMWERINVLDAKVERLINRQDQSDELLRKLSPAVEEFTVYKTRAQGAGVLGRALWWFGGLVLAGAAWLYNNATLTFK